ncbi:MAG: hypothetical protein AAGK14_05465 [Verrucomicrobiota bacterium]
MARTRLIRCLLLVAVIALAVAVVTFTWPRASPEPEAEPVETPSSRFLLIKKAPEGSTPQRPNPSTTPGRSQPSPTVAERDARGVNYLPQVVAFADELNAPSGNPRNDVDTLVNLMDIYRRMVGEGYPSGLNREIVRQLQGDNGKKLAVLPSSFPGLNPEGEITDRWNTPYFFHNVSDTQVEIRSAGPDRTFWTDDDIAEPETPLPIKAPVALPRR